MRQITITFPADSSHLNEFEKPVALVVVEDRLGEKTYYITAKHRDLLRTSIENVLKILNPAVGLH